MVPFTLARPSCAGSVVALPEDLEFRNNRTQAFFKRRGILVAGDSEGLTLDKTTVSTSTETTLPLGGDSDENTDTNIDGTD